MSSTNSSSTIRPDRNAGSSRSNDLRQQSQHGSRPQEQSRAPSYTGRPQTYSNSNPMVMVRMPERPVCTAWFIRYECGHEKVLVFQKCARHRPHPELKCGDYYLGREMKHETDSPCMTCCRPTSMYNVSMHTSF